tara:strand:+ start:368 stop:1291 length:924 start_codon:yes stop_codon:yes gene_type:complete
MQTKQLLGQYYTTTDPFNNSDAFKAWYSLVPKDEPVLEPFAGAGNLFEFIDTTWDGYDIDPQHFNVAIRDTIKDFPKGYQVCITNPPYLAKTVISRKKLRVSIRHEDLYLDCLQLMLDNCDYVASIIPSTFYNQNLFKDRLFAWDKFDMKLFSDTDNPAGVAYFVPNQVQTKLYVNGQSLDVDDTFIPKSSNFPVVFNPPDFSEYIINGIDMVDRDNIHLRRIKDKDRQSLVGSNGKCKGTNRNIFPIECSYLRDKHISLFNEAIEEYRQQSNDFYMTSFKSLQKSGKYRKRVSFKEVRWLLEKVIT